jgi:hypothetical protein
MEDIDFCPACGKNVEPGTPYCPACGARLNDPVTEKREMTQKDQAENKMGSDRIIIAAVLILGYSVFSLFLGAYLFADAENLVHWIFTDPAFASYVADLAALGYGEERMLSLLEITAILMIISGGAGVVAAVLALMKKFWVLTIILCIMSALIGIVTLFGLILGIIAFWMLYKARSVFES